MTWPTTTAAVARSTTRGTSTSAGARSATSTTRAGSSSRPATGARPSPAAPASRRAGAASPSGPSAATATSSPSSHAAQRAGDDRAGTVEAFRAETAEVTLDNQGRLTLPPELRERVGIGGHGATVAIEGQGDHLEIRALDRRERPRPPPSSTPSSTDTDSTTLTTTTRSRPQDRHETRDKRRTAVSGPPTRCPPDGRWTAPTPPADHQLDRGDIPTSARRPGGSRWAEPPAGADPE